MVKQPPYTIEFAPETLDHLGAIDRKHYRLIEKTIDEQLSHTPDQETRNRKPVEQPAPFSTSWELRFGPANCFRVFYDIDVRKRQVQVLAIGVKKGNLLFISGEELEL